MKLYFFGLLMCSRKYKTFADVHGDVLADNQQQARNAAFIYARGIENKSNDIYLVGVTVQAADDVRVPDYV